MTRKEEIARLTFDPGARRLAELVDVLEAELATLKRRVDQCCDATPVPLAPKPNES